MESLSKHSAVTQRNLRYLVACLLTGFVASSVLACASDDTDESDKESNTAEDKATEDKDSKADSDKAASEDKSASDDKATTVEEFHPMASAEQEAASKQQMRYDGKWSGTTSQDKPVSFSILSRFLGHIEITYALEGDGCKSEDKTAKVSVMNGLRMGGFSVNNTSATEKLMTTGTMTADSESEGMFTIEAQGDVPEGCNKMLTGTWKATK